LPRELLEIILAGPHELVLAEFVLEETSRVLRYPRMQNFYKLSSEDIAEHAELLRASSDLVSPTVHHPVVLNDSNDDPVVYTAVNGRADISVP
jgi:predicted nucleic acid-binding protein